MLVKGGEHGGEVLRVASTTLDTSCTKGWRYIGSKSSDHFIQVGLQNEEPRLSDTSYYKVARSL